MPGTTSVVPTGGGGVKPLGFGLPSGNDRLLVRFDCSVFALAPCSSGLLDERMALEPWLLFVESFFPNDIGMLPAGGGNAVPVRVGAATNCEPSGHRSATTSRALSALSTTPEMLESFELTFPTTLPAASHGSRSCISRFNSASAAARFRVATSPASSRELEANSIPRAPAENA